MIVLELQEGLYGFPVGHLEFQQQDVCISLRHRGSNFLRARRLRGHQQVALLREDSF